MVTFTFAGVAGQLAGIRTPLSVVLIDCTWIDTVKGPSVYVLGMLANEMFSPKPAGSVAGRTAISPGAPSWEVWPSSVTSSASPARSPGLGGATRSNATWPVTGSSPRPVAETVPLPTWQAGVGV